MGIVVENYEDVLDGLETGQLLKLKETLNNLNFFSAKDLVFGAYQRHFFSERYGWKDGGGYNKTTRLNYSEIFLYNTVTKKDALTSEDLDKGYQTHFEDYGHRGEIFEFTPISKHKSLEDQALLYQLLYQKVYSDYDRVKLLEFYNKWCRIMRSKPPFTISREGEEKIVLPLRQYEKWKNGKVKALKPLQFF